MIKAWLSSMFREYGVKGAWSRSMVEKYGWEVWLSIVVEVRG
jgi:negative regulator of genetic competence, sporulation and motility